MNKNYFKKVVALMFTVLFAGTFAFSAETTNMHSVSGEIGWVDVQAGKLELNEEILNGTKTTTYNITQNETRVTDAKDEKFLNVGDLRAGQYVILEMINDQEDNVIPKIILEPMPASEYQQAFGELKAIDVEVGTLTLEEKVKIGQQEVSRESYFVFDPKTIIVKQSPNKQPVELMLKPGDVLKVEFIQQDGKQQAHDITLYSPVVKTIITKTTVTTTQ